MEPFAFFIIGIALIGVVAVVNIRNKQGYLRAWQAFAQEQHLRLLDAGTWSNPRMEGRYRDLAVTLQIEVRGSGKHKKTYTRAIARFPMTMPRGLNITSEGFSDRLAKLVGGQDIEIGHAALDRQLRIRGEDVPAVLDLMENWRARNAIAAFVARDPSATVTQHQCTIVRHGFVHVPSELRGMLEGVCRAVTEIRRGLQEPDAMPGQEATAPGEETSRHPTTPEAPAAARFDWEPAPVVPEGLPREVLGLIEGQGGVFSTTRETLSVTEIGPEGTRTQYQTWIDGQLQASEVVVPSPPEPLVAEAPAAPATPTSPAPVVPSAEPAADSPPVPLEALLALADRDLASPQIEALAARLVGRTVQLELEVERVSLTMGMGIPRALEGGHTVIGSPVGHPGPRLAARFAPQRSDAVSGLGYGDRISLRGRFAAWDGFYRQAQIDVA
jgi:hypothetical protein